MRPSNPDMDRELDLKHAVLDHGMVRVVDYMGDDSAVVQAARVSYGKGTNTPSDDRSLIRYLLRRHHTTPFEMCEIKLHVKLPVFVARQWIRHRTANVNEYSARYSILANEFYIPEAKDIKPQSQSNKQGREGDFSKAVRADMRSTIEAHSQASYDLYEELYTGWPWFGEDGVEINPNQLSVSDIDLVPEPHREGHGMTRELARMVCPPNIYTEWYWKVDLHNLLHFLRLRADPHAQKEIRDYANVICGIVKRWCPETFAAFEDYVVNAVTFSAAEMDMIRNIVETYGSIAAPNFYEDLAQINEDLSRREESEFLEKIGVKRK